MSEIVTIPAEIDRYLRGYMSRARRIALVRRVGAGIAFTLAWLLLWCMVDRLWPLTEDVRLAAIGIGAVLLISLGFRTLFICFGRRVDLRLVASEVEQRMPELGQRMETVIAQALMLTHERASRAMTAQLGRQIEPMIKSKRPESLLPLKHALGPWAAVIALILVSAGLAISPWLDLSRVAHRIFMPMAPIDPATTSRLKVEPGTTNVVAGHAVNILVQAQRVGDEPVRIHLSGDGQSYIASTMSPSQSGYVYLIPAADRDLQYYITGGDARATYDIHVLQPPAVKQFEATYVYPAYMQRETLHVSNSDGAIEAPVGTQATIEVVATEPLKLASLATGFQAIALVAGRQENILKTTLAMNKDEHYQLKMVSRDGVDGVFPGSVTLRAMPDRPPLARLLHPDTDLRLHPRDVLPISFQALDDYGIAQLAIEAQVNARPVQPIPLALKGDPRRQEATFELDLAALKLNIGDVLSLEVVVLDGSGQKAVSEMRHILVSPRSIDLNTHERISSLKESAALSSTIVDALTGAAKAIEEADQSSTTRPAERPSVGRVIRFLGNEAESAGLLRQELLSSLSHSASSQQSTLLAGLLDSDALIAALSELSATRLNAGSRSLETSLKPVQTALQTAKSMRIQLAVVSQSEQSAALLADRANLEAAKTAKPDPGGAERLAQTIQRAEKELSADVTELGLKADALDLEFQLQKRVDQAKAVLQEAKPIDLVELAQQWTLNLGKPELANIALPQRLEAASDAESARPDPDLIRARDLQLCSRAARMMEAGLAQENRESTSSIQAAQRQQFAPALAALEQEHLGSVHPVDARTSAAAAEARAKMRRWAAEPDLLLTAAQAIERQRQSLAMEANAEMIARNYDRAGQLDEKTHGTSQPAMRAVQRVDQVSDQQQLLAQETANATVAQAQSLSDRQRQVAEAIDRAQEQNRADLGQAGSRPSEQFARQQVLTVIQHAQETLAALPQRLDAARQASELLHQALEQLAMVKSATPGATPEAQAATKRIVDQATKSLADAQQKWLAISQQASAATADALAQDLLQVGPDTAAPSRTIQQALLPALDALNKAGTTGDSGAMDQAAEQARRALSRIQDQLRAAQTDLVERDPLVAALWFAQAASAALQQKPPDFPAAMRHQASASEALSRAWVGVVRQAAAQRLSEAAAPMAQIPVSPKWGNLTVSQNTGPAAPLRDSDAPEYEDAIKAYFEALAKAGETPQ